MLPVQVGSIQRTLARGKMVGHLSYGGDDGYDDDDDNETKRSQII